jgi:hypothetical protein
MSKGLKERERASEGGDPRKKERRAASQATGAEPCSIVTQEGYAAETCRRLSTGPLLRRPGRRPVPISSFSFHHHLWCTIP